MTANLVRKPEDAMCNTHQLAAYTTIPARHFERLRCEGGGPPFIKIGRSVRYRWSDVDAWLDSQRKTTTYTQEPSGDF